MASRSVYTGPRRKLVLAFDIGTTYSGISYSVLDPGQVPEIRGVTRFPANEQISGASKIPTIIYYDSSGKVQAVGAEAMREGIYEQAEDGQWVKAEWFKLHLRPRVSPEVSNDIPPLPLKMTVVEVFADFLAYLFKCASSYIQETHAKGIDLWASVKDEIDFVLTHPNGWEGVQQSKMRKAAVLAGLIPDTIIGHARLLFVTEGEASLHFAVQNGLPDGVMKNGEGVVIVDAGGGTIDVSSYSRNTTALKPFFEEVAAPQCHFQGSVFVSIHARFFLRKYLAQSPFADDTEHIVRCFDKTTKPRFANVEDAQYIKFGSTRDNDAQSNIRFGQLKLLGTDVALFFEPSIKCIIKAVVDQKKAAYKPISHVVLVGGFAASNYMFDKIHTMFASEKLSVLRPENHVNKAVSDGAISFYLDRFVKTRVSKVTYGVFCDLLYDPNKPDHRERRSNTYTSASGLRYIHNSFDVILPKNTHISETTEFRQPYVQVSDSIDKLEDYTASISLWCYRGLIAEPKWKEVDTNNYTKLCYIDVDLYFLPWMKQKKKTGRGIFYRAEYEVVLLFGLTELEAQIVWKEGDTENRTAAKIIYSPDVADSDNTA